MEYGAVLVWWAAAVAIGAAGLPIAAAILGRLPDRGAALSFPLGVVVLTVPIYWIGHLSYGPLTIWVGVAILFGAAAVLTWRGPTPDLVRFGEAIVVFSAAFFLLVAVRATDPSIYTLGGEKFLDYGLLNAVLRSSRLPPEDMWFAGEPVQYYYGGHLIAGIVTSITGVAARYSYNLALAWFYGLLAVAAYGVAGATAAVSGRSYRLAGAVGALFVAFASNLVPVVQALLWPLPDGVATAIASRLATIGPDGGYGLTSTELADPESARTAYYWIPSRVIEGMINEFPLFAFLNGDLHAHMMSTPFLLLVVGLALAYYRTPEADVWRRRALVFGAIPPVAGLIAVVNTWSFPTTVGVTWLALYFAPSDPLDLPPRALGGRLRTAGQELRRLAGATGAAAGTLLLGVVWALPFFVGPATGATGRSLGFVVDRSDIVGFSLVHGWILLVFGVYLGVRAVDEIETDRPRVAILGIVALAVGLLADAAAFALVLPLAVLAWISLRRGDSDLGFETVLFVGGAGLVLLVEVLFLVEEAGPGRMNTVFKTYMQVWVLWAIAAAVPVGRALSGGSTFASERWRRIGTVAAVALLLSVSIYGTVALADRYSSAGEPTLDATTWARNAHTEEWEAIRWLDDNVEGQPNMVSAPGTGPYDWVNAPSSFTGVPTLAGWAHERGYRGSDVYNGRVSDVETIYTGSWEQQRELLARHDVEYVYVGPNERSRYGDPGFASRDAFEVAFDNRLVTIYRVDRSAL